MVTRVKYYCPTNAWCKVDARVKANKKQDYSYVVSVGKCFVSCNLQMHFWNKRVLMLAVYIEQNHKLEDILSHTHK